MLMLSGARPPGMMQLISDPLHSVHLFHAWATPISQHYWRELLGVNTNSGTCRSKVWVCHFQPRICPCCLLSKLNVCRLRNSAEKSSIAGNQPMVCFGMGCWSTINQPGPTQNSCCLMLDCFSRECISHTGIMAPNFRVISSKLVLTHFQNSSVAPSSVKWLKSRV